ncbi:uncharacterized protein VTP21DRAFT_5024 [Calcarisporiella thermophila]|uniref:uncharacterized protein n=1 Tax=Calcarisporiella thermophila TaxID=911321 RepID=UPI0037441B21
MSRHLETQTNDDLLTPSPLHTPRTLSTLSMRPVRPSAALSYGGTGRLDTLTPMQEVALERFRSELQQGGYFDPSRHDDHCLLRFLRARKFDLDATKAMFIACEKWRKEFGVDKLVKEFEFPEAEKIAKIYPRYYHKTDRIGRPIYIEHLGNIDVNELFKITTEDRMLKQFVVGYEKLINQRFVACSAKAGRHIEQSFTIMDLKGVKMMNITTVLGFVRLTSSIAQDYYPELMGKMYIINAPFLFSSIWALIKPFLDEVTVNKIHILGSRYQSALLKDIDPENLPSYLGGKCTCAEQGGCRSSDAGPWQNPEYLNHNSAEINGNHETNGKDEKN